MHKRENSVDKIAFSKILTPMSSAFVIKKIFYQNEILSTSFFPTKHKQRTDLKSKGIKHNLKIGKDILIIIVRVHTMHILV